MKIAVVGIGCRYPGANNATELFENILAGRRYFREFPPERWRLEDYYHADRNHPDKTYNKLAAFIEGFEFSPAAFKIPHSTFKATDMAQWLSLAVAKEALDDADLGELPRPTTAVILGNTLTGETSRAHLVRYRWPYARRVFDELLDELGMSPELKARMLARIEQRYKAPFPPVNEDNLAGGLANTIAGRICNYFDFQGGGYTVDGACSSSLLSIQEACVGLDQRLCDLVLAGGVDISLDPFELVGFAKVGALSDSDIRVYDQRSNGFLPGEGCGIVVLKRLEDAVADKNRIYAVIRGVGYSSDGRGGITAPSVTGQSLAVDRAYYVAGYPFAEVDLVEGHGTGTPVGDRTELTTFIEAKRRHGATPEHRCGIGSIKSIIGHTKAAAGVAGFIKATLSAYYKVLPPTMGLGIPNELFGTSPHLYPLIKGSKWRGEEPMRAAVSSAGFGGINTHITMESYGGAAARHRPMLDAAYLMQSYQDSEAFLIGADDVAGLHARVAELAAVAKRLCHAELIGLAALCAQGSANKYVRLGVVAATPAALHQKLERVHEFLAQHDHDDAEVEFVDQREGIFLQKSFKSPRIAFLFPGQGSQYLNMGRRERERYPLVARHWDECDAVLREQLPGKLSAHVVHEDYWARRENWDDWNRDLRDTKIAQPAIVTASMAAAELLGYFGIQPEVALGHSLGEYTALWSSGALDKASTLQLVCSRGAAMATSADTAGAMLSIADGPDKAHVLLEGLKGYATIANYNAPNQTVVSGEEPVIEALSARCVQAGVTCTRLPVSCAFHSRLMNAARDKMRGVLADTVFSPMRHLVISSATGGFIGDVADLPTILTEQITQPVRFTDAIRSALEEGIDTFVEVGPSTALSGLARRIIGAGRALVFATDNGPQEDDCANWNALIAYAFACGLPIIGTRLFENRFYRPFQLPYQPKFIASPCETPVDRLTLGADLKGIGATLPIDETLMVAGGDDAAQPQSATASEDAGAWTAERIFAMLQKFIVERFGYPSDMVTRDTRLLEDLNLDSIKSAEVVAEAMGRVNLIADPTGFTKLRLGEIAAKLEGLLGAQPAPAAGVAPAASPTDQLPTWVRNFEVRLVEESLAPTEHEYAEGAVLVVAPTHDSVVAALEAAMTRAGLKTIVQVGDASASITGPLAGCVVIGPEPGSEDLARLDGPALEQRLFGFPQLMLHAAKGFIGAVKNQAMKGRFFALVTRAGGRLGRDNCADAAGEALAGAGFVKSLSLEQPGLNTRVIDCDASLAPEVVAAHVFGELGGEAGHREAGYAADGKRYVPRVAPRATSTLARKPLALGNGDVVVVSGGAKGITAECMLALSRGRAAKLALLGSSAAPQPNGEAATDEIGRNLERFHANGIDARYYQCDITDADSVRTCIERIELELGPISGVVHAAGVNTPHRVESVSMAEFDRVLRPKMLGLALLLKHVDSARLKLLVVFSSVIAQSGMPGNSDYAYANAWMNLIVRRLGNAHPALRCRAFGFSVWAELGMGARLNSVDGLRRIGVDAIPPEEGVRRFVELIERDWKTIDLIIAARLGKLGTLPFASAPPPPQRFLENVLVHQPGVELLVEVALKPDTDRYLADHNYDGALLFPAVLGIEAMVETAAACLGVANGAARPVLENLVFSRPIVVPPEGRAIRIYALADEETEDGARRVAVGIRSSVTGYDVDYFRGECVWRVSAEKPPSVKPRWPRALAINPQESLYGTIFFQGAMFQNIVSYHDISETHCVAKIKVPPASRLFDPAAEFTTILDFPEVRDTFLHAIQLCVPRHRILPVAMEAVEPYGFADGTEARAARQGRRDRGFAGKFLYLVARERSHTDEEYLYDLDVYDKAGRCVERIRGYRCRVVDSFRDDATLARVEALHQAAAQRVDSAAQVSTSA